MIEEKAERFIRIYNRVRITLLVIILVVLCYVFTTAHYVDDKQTQKTQVADVVPTNNQQ